VSRGDIGKISDSAGICIDPSIVEAFQEVFEFYFFGCEKAEGGEVELEVFISRFQLNFFPRGVVYRSIIYQDFFDYYGRGLGIPIHIPWVHRDQAF